MSQRYRQNTARNRRRVGSADGKRPGISTSLNNAPSGQRTRTSHCCSSAHSRCVWSSATYSLTTGQYFNGESNIMSASFDGSVERRNALLIASVPTMISYTPDTGSVLNIDQRPGVPWRQDPAEWHTFERLCLIPISRLYRDRGIFDTLEPDRRFDLILCRNFVLTYFEPALQRAVMARIVETLRPAGALIVGSRESLPDALPEIEPWTGARCTYRKLASHAAEPCAGELAHA
ncbi:MAG: CheR family methyltransferase [Burkholderiales bacterium]